MSRFLIQRLLITLLALVIAGVGAPAEQAVQESAVKLAGLYLKLGQFDQCRAAIDGLLKENPKNPEALTLLGRLELKQNHAEASLKAASAALAVSPDSSDATVVKARAIALQGQKADALKVLSRLSAADLEKYDDELSDSGLIVSNGGTPGTAAESNDDALDNLLEGARNALAKKDYIKADSLTKSALSRAPSNSDAVALRADYLSSSDKPAEAVALLQKLKAAQRKSGAPFTEELALGYALGDAGKADEAKASFEAVAGNSAYSDADRQQAREALEGLQTAKTITDGEAAMDAGKAREALRIATEVLAKDSANEDAKVLQARAMASTGKAHEAVETLQKMKAKVGPEKHFDAQLDYANALAEDHRYHDSVNAYSEVISKPGIYNEEERNNAREQLADLRETHLGGVDLQTMYGTFEEGTFWRTTGQIYSSRMGRTRYSVGSEWDHIQLEDKIYPRSLTSDRSSSSVTFDTMWDDQWRTFFHVGGFEHGALAGATLDYTLPGGMVFGLSADYNDPAKDTLLLAAMDGRQHALTANITVPMGEHFVLESMINGRQLEADGANIGHAVGTETQFRWHPISTSDQLYFAYSLELKDFSPNDGAFDQKALNFFGRGSSFTPSATDAVPDHINRHALQAHGSIDILAHVTASALAEVAWRQETDKIEYGAVAEILWHVSEKASLNARVEYYSGGSGPNTGEGVTLGTIGTKFRW